MFPASLDDVQIVGMDKNELRINGFKLPASYSKQRKNDISKGGFLMGLVKRSYTVEPRIIKSSCTACGACQKACPRDAIQIIDKHSVIDQKACIRCYCCHEMCQYNAIELHQSFLYRMANHRN
jgi:ferredoxin